MGSDGKYSQIKAGAILSYLSMGLGNLVALAYTPIMIRLLGQSEYGLYTLVYSVIAYLGVLNFGFGSAYTRYYIRYKMEGQETSIARLNGMFISIFSCIGLVAVIIGVLAALNIEVVFGNQLTIIEQQRAQVLAIILTFNLAFSFPSSVFTSNITANERFVFQNSLQLVKLITSPFITLPVLLLGYGSIGMAIATSIINLAVEVVSAVYCLKKLNMRFLFRGFDTKLIREITVFSSYIFIGILIDQINWHVDKFILGRYHGTVSVAIYGLAAQINTYYMGISTSISNVFIPRIHQLVSKSSGMSELSALFIKIGRIQFILLMLVASAFVFFGEAFVALWAGPGYRESWIIAMLLIIPVTIPTIQNIGIEIQRALNKHQYRSWVYLGMAVFNTILTLWLARPYEGIGAAIGTAISLVVGNGILMNWYYYRKIGLSIPAFWKSILRFVPALILPIVSGVMIKDFINLSHWSSMLLFGGVYVVIYSLSMWAFGLNQYEKQLFGKLLRNLSSKIIRRK